MTKRGQRSEPEPPAAEDLRTEDGKRLFEEQVREVWKIVQKSADDFDKSILTYSASALGLSVAFVQNVTPKQQAVHTGFLFTAWILFTCAICLTIISFKVSSRAQYVHLDHCKKYYVDGEEDYLTKQNWWNVGNELLTIAAGISFALGVVSIATFGIMNFGEVKSMQNKNGVQFEVQKGAPTNLKVPVSSTPTSPASSQPQSTTSTSQSSFSTGTKK